MSADSVAPRLLGVSGGAGAFAEVGHPRVAVRTRSGLVVGGSLPLAGAAPCWPDQVLAAYDEHLVCRWVEWFREPVNSLAVHPSEPLLAVGTGGYDGGWAWEGVLALVRLDGEPTLVSLLRQRRHVTHVGWADDDTLEAVLMPHDEDTDPLVRSTVRLVRPHWDDAEPGSADAEEHVVAVDALPEDGGWTDDAAGPRADLDTGPATAMVHELAGRAGLTLRPWGSGPGLPGPSAGERSRVEVEATGSGDLAARHPASGSAWHWRPGGGREVVAHGVRDDVVLAALDDGSLVVLHAASGRERWCGPVPGIRGAQPVGVRVGRAGEAWVKLRDGRLVRLALR